MVWSRPFSDTVPENVEASLNCCCLQELLEYETVEKAFCWVGYKNKQTNEEFVEKEGMFSCNTKFGEGWI